MPENNYYDESWEFQNNTSDRMLFKSDDFVSIYIDPETLEEKPAWKNDFEARFPDDTYDDTTQLQTFMTWIVSTDRTAATNETLEPSVTYDGTEYTLDTTSYRLAKFKAEFPDYAELSSFLFYYIFTEFFLMVDSRAKNLFIGFHGSECEVEGIRRKLVAEPYDMDTGLGTNNEGTLSYTPGLEDTDLVSGANVFNGQGSVLWCNLRDSYRSEIITMYRTLRSTGGLTYDAVEGMFESAQSVWPEAIWNEDAQSKYFDPLTNPDPGKEATDFYLPMCQGSKEQQRKWWLQSRFAYMDSKWNAGDALSQVIQLRGYAKADVTVTPYIDLYPTVKYGSYLVQTRGSAGIPQTLTCPMDAVNDTEIYIYSARQIANAGDLSGLKVGVADFSAAVNIQEVKVGDSDVLYDNPNMVRLSFGSNVLLKKIDARNCSALGTGEQRSVDISNCSIIEEAYFDGTAIQGLTLPNGGVLRKLHVPATMTNLTIMNQKNITELVIPSYSNITTLRIENSSVDSKAMLNAIDAGTRVRLIGFSWTCTNAQEIEDLLDQLDDMRGLDENGNNTETAQVSGTISTAALTGSQVASYLARYPYITYDAHVSSVRTYADYDGTVLKTVNCIDGEPQDTAPANPSRSSTAQYTFSFVGWALTEDAQAADASALDNVNYDRTIYAAYSRTVRTYTVTWKNTDNTTLETDTNVPYGTTPTYNGSTPQNPTSGGGSFQGWTPAISAVTGNITYTASYIPTYTVTWYNDDRSTVLDTQTVQQGGSATYSGTNPPVSTNGNDYTFTGWSGTTTNVQSNLSIYAQYQAPSDAPTATDAAGAYGVEWDYSSDSPTLTRKGLATSFADPSPATSVSGSGSSPFDSILPWSAMKRYNIINGTVSYSEDDAGFSQTAYDTVVYIPEFYYTAYKDTGNSKWLWAISPTQLEGYKKHPGSGRYAGRYHTSGDSTEVFTKSGIAPLVSTSQTNFRSYSHNKGSDWYMMDLATWSAIQLLYLVEYASFASQTKLGEGFTGQSAVGAGGGTDSAAYHTITATGSHNQYRWIEDPFSNCRDWIDGFLGSTSSVYAGVSDSGYTGSTSGLENTGISLPSSGAIRGFGYSDKAAWAFIPDTASGSTDNTEYVTDYVYSHSSQRPASVGGYYSSSAYCGFFYMGALNAASYASAYLGSRLLFIP